ncbi:hypothetical protein LWI28_022504 [Acer negundo]|uniref:Thioredoxin domain-containing protein n=1 Tax=Acer negundo TaxID=4023 RepID=A0AAD5IMR4_ACENE|nr:hypothetical protein LWI28_022504 [Acer negundo]KAK4841351.1 hypothetical protein QYF36_003113 [Acer negundo]
MGANMSSCENPHGFLHKSHSQNQILEFQSKDQWKAHFEASKETNKLLVIDFTATWCGPCKSMEPAIKEFVAKYTEVEFIKIDVDKFKEIAKQFGIEAMPTFILVKKGKEVDRLVGAKKDDLQKKIEKHRT